MQERYVVKKIEVCPVCKGKLRQEEVYCFTCDGTGKVGIEVDLLFALSKVIGGYKVGVPQHTHDYDGVYYSNCPACNFPNH